MKLPRLTKIDNIIINTVKKHGGIIVGSFAVKVFHPHARNYNDIDVIIHNKGAFSRLLASVLNNHYPGRFTLERSFNAMRIYDNVKGKYVVDIATYPITRKDYILVQGVYIAKPEFVYKGRAKKESGGLNLSRMGLMPTNRLLKVKRFI
ncbi:hypothetical protein DRN98_07445 [Methanosarcinales archaeon]|nr:MAG: hypothetical protein DRN98_07445 [Methanosarcinales archaeon]